MTEKTQEIVLSRESLREIAQEAADMVVSQLFLEDRIEISPDQTDKLADKVAARLDATVDYDKIRDASDGNKVFSEIGQLRTDVFSKVSALEDDLSLTKTGPERDTYKLTAKDRADIAGQALSGLDLPEEFRNMLVRSFVSRTFFNEKIGALTKFVRENRSKLVTAGISGGDMVEEINKALGTADWQTGGGAAGDMLKSVYDTNDDGKVGIADAADSVPWSGITGKPSIGDMSGPAGATDGEIFVSDGTTGKLAKVEGVSIGSNREIKGFSWSVQDSDSWMKVNRFIKYTTTGDPSAPLKSLFGIGASENFQIFHGVSFAKSVDATKDLWNILPDLIVNKNIGQKVHLNSFSNPPTAAELDVVFGTPVAVGDKFTASINNGGAGTNFYRVYSDGASWHIVTATKAV